MLSLFLFIPRTLLPISSPHSLFPTVPTALFSYFCYLLTVFTQWHAHKTSAWVVGINYRLKLECRLEFPSVFAAIRSLGMWIKDILWSEAGNTRKPMLIKTPDHNTDPGIQYTCINKIDNYRYSADIQWEMSIFRQPVKKIAVRLLAEKGASLSVRGIFCQIRRSFLRVSKLRLLSAGRDVNTSQYALT